MTKVIISFVIFFLFSCNSVNTTDLTFYRNVADVFTQPFKSEKNNITKDFYIQFPYSFAKAELKNNNAIIVLSNYNPEGIYTWVSSDMTEVITKNGVIIQTLGLENDVKVINSNWLDDILKREKVNCYYDYSDPEIYSIATIFTKISEEKSSMYYLDEEVFLTEHKYLKTSPQIKWKSYISIFTDSKNRVIKTKEKFHPYLDEIEIIFYLK